MSQKRPGHGIPSLYQNVAQLAIVFLPVQYWRFDIYTLVVLPLMIVVWILYPNLSSVLFSQVFRYYETYNVLIKLYFMSL